jgi:hypothetical protein
MATATRAGNARPKVRRIVIETLTFIQVRHRADNSLSVPTQKAAPGEMIAGARLATVVLPDMVATVADEKAVQFLLSGRNPSLPQTETPSC